MSRITHSPLKLGAPPLELSFWVVADTHFGHDNIASFCARPADHDRLMLDRWRETVTQDDLVVHLGDVCWWNTLETFETEIGPFLTGRKLMLIGNHDIQEAGFYEQFGFTIIEPFVLELDGWKVRFTHGPDLDWVQYPKHLNVHGHIHSKLIGDRRHLNLSVEWTDYRPVRAEHAIRTRIRQIEHGDEVGAEPTPYDEWQAREYGGTTIRKDTDRFADPAARTEARRRFTEYRLQLAPDALIRDSTN
jgi:calcineurin-like phosphoesterase family protein